MAFPDAQLPGRAGRRSRGEQGRGAAERFESNGRYRVWNGGTMGSAYVQFCRLGRGNSRPGALRRTSPTGQVQTVDTESPAGARSFAALRTTRTPQGLLCLTVTTSGSAL